MPSGNDSNGGRLRDPVVWALVTAALSGGFGGHAVISDSDRQFEDLREELRQLRHVVSTDLTDMQRRIGRLEGRFEVYFNGRTPRQ